MSYYRFGSNDVLNIGVLTYPSHEVQLNGNQVTGSVYLEHPYLNSRLSQRLFLGFSQKEGGLVEKNGPFTSSIDILDVEYNADNKQLYESVLELYDYYRFTNSNYTASFTGSETTRFRVIVIPEIYYDRQILTGSLTASDLDSSGDSRLLYDDGLGGIYSGSVSGTLVGNVFYNEGLVVLKGGGLNDEAAGEDFGQASSTNFKWKVNFKGTHKLPVKVFNCRAPAGQLNATTNETFHVVPSGSADRYKFEKEIISKGVTYVTTIGLYNEDYELVGMAKLAQPIRKDEAQDILFRLRLDF